jgi:hypothetical protein
LRTQPFFRLITTPPFFYTSSIVDLEKVPNGV